ncbi:hypothetical protein N9T79_00060 [Candidatus Pelagibacter sp.]|jgi:hypothetical protein|nr:hypothetical protein [Candidatus Pelagibacter sp.]
MCGSIFRAPKPPPPPPTPAPPATIVNAQAASVRESKPSVPQSASYNSAVATRRRGKRALRIPLNQTALANAQSGVKV